MLSRVKAPKILAVASAVDLDYRYGCTPAWWQLWKGLYEVGVDLIVTPYRGRPVESPWWRTAPNPTWVEGESFAAVRGRARAAEGRPLPAPRRGLAGRDRLRQGDARDDLALGDAALAAAPDEGARGRERTSTRSSSSPCRWRTSAASRPILRERFGVPVIFYDGDVPMSLPEFGGMDTGFNYYHGADPSEYDLVVSNSEGGLPSLRELGARRAEAVFWGADPEFFAPRPVEKLHDVFFYGYGDKFRRDWMAAMVGEPSRAAPELEFALGGRDFQGDTGRAWLVGDVPFNAFAQAISAVADQPQHHAPLARERLRLVLVPPVRARRAPAPRSSRTRTRGSSAGSSRARSCSSSTTPTRRSPPTASLLDDPAQAEAMGARARERVLDEHTYAHRARQLLSLVGLGVPAGARA